jgi:hypothetical protein
MKLEKQIVGILLLGFFFLIGITISINILQKSNTPVVDSNLQTSNNPTPTVNPSVMPTTTPTTATTAKCIVTIDGQSYDVIKLRKTHSGGDVFTCGTDMTSIFYSQHSKSFLNSKMARYKI